jgi:hypothetical protein
VKLALNTLRQHKLRSFHRAWRGDGREVLMLVAARSRASIRPSWKDYDASANTVSISRSADRVCAPRPKEERERKPLTLEDGLALTECCPQCSR